MIRPPGWIGAQIEFWILLIGLAPVVAEAAERPDWAFPVTDKVQPQSTTDHGEPKTPPGRTKSSGLREIARLLRKGGECGILDFGEPTGAMGALYRVYFKRLLPRLGTMMSGVRGPYAYLPASVERFPAPEEMLERMTNTGFAEASWTPYTFGIAGLYWGKK